MRTFEIYSTAQELKLAVVVFLARDWITCIDTKPDLRGIRVPDKGASPE